MDGIQLSNTQLSNIQQSNSIKLNQTGTKKPCQPSKVHNEEHLALPLQNKEKNWDSSEVLKICTGLADDYGHVQAQTQVGLINLLKLNKENVALNYFHKAADNGDKDGQNNLGYMYENGLGGLNQDIQEALVWYKKAADQGLDVAKSNVDRLANNRSIPRNVGHKTGTQGSNAGQSSFDLILNHQRRSELEKKHRVTPVITQGVQNENQKRKDTNIKTAFADSRQTDLVAKKKIGKS
jgi:TPR repeat protein